MLPGRDGLEILSTLRKQGLETPVVVLTARDTLEDRVVGLDAGADDYLVKPFAFAELLARLRAVARRGRGGDADRLTVDTLEIDRATRRVTRDGHAIELTAKEFDLLHYLTRNARQVVSRDTLAREVWRETALSTTLDNVIDVHISRLRRKIDLDQPVKLIHTVRGSASCCGQVSHERRRGPHPAGPGGGGRLHPTRRAGHDRARRGPRGGGRRPASGRGGTGHELALGAAHPAGAADVLVHAVMVAVLGVYVSVVLALVARNLSDALDARLRSDFRWAAEMAEQGPDGSLSWFEGEPWTEGPWLQVWSPGGELIYRTSVAARLPVPASEAMVDEADGRIRSLPDDPAPFRLLGARATVAGRPVVIQVGRSEAFMRFEVRELAVLLLLGLPLTVAVAGAGGYVLARGALSPLHRMAERARAINAANLDERLPIDSPRDELGRLAAVFNDTLGRLESSFTQMRQFTADVSHGLRTPLTAIRSVGEVGLREHRDAGAYERVIQSMLEETDRLTRLIDRLLLVSRADRGDLALAHRPVELAALADDVAAHLGVLAEEKRQSLTVEQAARPRCLGDPIALRQAVINLVDNAIRYTPAEGDIRLRVAVSSGNAVLEVGDTGPGIPDRDRSRLFDRFYRGAQGGAAGGSGLGLSIAKWAVEASRGRLAYERNGGRGSLFRITLPLAPERREPSGLIAGGSATGFAAQVAGRDGEPT